jgi:hypothetical protein
MGDRRETENLKRDVAPSGTETRSRSVGSSIQTGRVSKQPHNGHMLGTMIDLVDKTLSRLLPMASTLDMYSLRAF